MTQQRDKNVQIEVVIIVHVFFKKNLKKFVKEPRKNKNLSPLIADSDAP